MYISLNGSLTAGRVPWPEFVRLAARLGYGGVDLNLGAAMKEGRSATLAILEHLRIKPASTGLPVEFRKDDGAFRTGLKTLPEAAAFSAAVGCPRMLTWILPSTDTPKPELRKIYRERFTACAAVLRDNKVRLGLEFVSPVHLRRRSPHEFIWRMNEMLEFARECGPNVGLLLDAWHWHHAGATVDDILKAGKDGVVGVHVSDAPDDPPEKILDNQRLMPGEGVIDLVAFFRALGKIGYEDGISPEVLGRGLKDMPPEQGARLGLETTLAIMKKAGVA